MPELLTLAPGVEVPTPDDGATLRYSEEAVQDTVDFFGLLCFGQNDWAGKPFQLQDWESDAIRQFYGVQTQNEDGEWIRYRRFLYEELPKKNGKTEFAAALGLKHLLWDGETLPKVGIFSSDIENAKQIYDAAKYMVEHTCLGEPEWDPVAWAVDSKREIRTKYGGVLKVYSSDAKTKHGYSFSAIIIDELHAQPNRALWEVLTRGSDAARRQQAVIVLTTAGDDPGRTSIAWEVHESCRRILAWRAGQPERETDTDDPAWCPIMFGISVITGDDPDKITALDIYNEELWHRCNPGLGLNLKLRDFRADARAAKKSDAAERAFRWLRLNQWISTKTVGWIPITVYDKTRWRRPEWEGLSVLEQRRAVRDALRGKKCYGGLDLSKSTDLTAFVLLFPPQEGLECWVTLFWAWIPLDDIAARETRDGVPYQDWIRADFLHGCPGDIIDYSDVESAIWEASGMFQIETLGLDPKMAWTLSQRLQNGTKDYKGLEVIVIPQDMASMSPPMKKMELLIRGKKLLHEHNTCARWCFGNVRCATDGNENIKPMKNRSPGRIDIPVAWIISMATAMVMMEDGPDSSEHINDPDWGI